MTENTMSAIELMHNALGIPAKINDPLLRVIYLKEVWGLKQWDIAKCEKTSQPIISVRLEEGLQKYGGGLSNIANLTALQFYSNEMKYLQELPREVLNDAQLIAFANYILRLNVKHPFYYATFKKPIIFAALASLGVQVKHMVNLFDTPQSTVSMGIKRRTNDMYKFISSSRYDFDMRIEVHTPKYETPTQNKFFVAGN